MRNLLVGAAVSAVVGVLSYLLQPEALSALVVAYPKFAVIAPIVTGVIGVLLPQLKLWAGSKSV